MRLRRGIIGLSLIGAASMAAVSLLQTGIVKTLPDPPLRRFDSRRVNSSNAAFAWGVPDGTISLASLAANVPLAAFGGARRAERVPWIPVLVMAKAAVEAPVAGYYFYRMPAKEQAWCGYCIVGAAATAGVLALALPEGLRALGQTFGRRARRR